MDDEGADGQFEEANATPNSIVDREDEGTVISTPPPQSEPLGVLENDKGPDADRSLVSINNVTRPTTPLFVRNSATLPTVGATLIGLSRTLSGTTSSKPPRPRTQKTMDNLNGGHLDITETVNSGVKRRRQYTMGSPDDIEDRPAVVRRFVDSIGPSSSSSTPPVVGSRSKEKSHPANHDGISDPHGKRPTKRIVLTLVQSQYATEVRNLTSEVEGEVRELEANEAHADDDMSSDNSQADEAPNDADDFMLPKPRNSKSLKKVGR